MYSLKSPQGMAQAWGAVRDPACQRGKGQGNATMCWSPVLWSPVLLVTRAGPGCPADAVPLPPSQSLPPVSLWLAAHSGCCVLQPGTQSAPGEAEPGAACAGSWGASAEPAPPPGEPSCAATRCSSSFPFFSHFHLAPPDEPQVPTCPSRVRRLTRFFQSPRRAVGPAAQGSASSCPGRPARQRQRLPQRRAEQ